MVGWQHTIQDKWPHTLYNRVGTLYITIPLVFLLQVTNLVIFCAVNGSGQEPHPSSVMHLVCISQHITNIVILYIQLFFIFSG